MEARYVIPSLYEHTQWEWYRRRRVRLSALDDINDAEAVATQVMCLADAGSDPIEIVISSEGGRVDAGLVVISALRYAQSRGIWVVGTVQGIAMSMALVVLQHCDIRQARPEDILMVHGISGVTVGDIRDQRADLELQEYLTGQWAELIARRNTAPEEQYHDPAFWRRLLDDATPTYLPAPKAREWGLLDRLVGQDD